MSGTDPLEGGRSPTPVPSWATDMVDMHVHSGPGQVPRHANDEITVKTYRELGFTQIVLKSHEESTVERARALTHIGDVHGGVVLNSAVGGADSATVVDAARSGGSIVWMPTVSATTHQRYTNNSELAPLAGLESPTVEVFDESALRPEWYDVLDLVATNDLVLASGHLSGPETVALFRIARERGVTRLMVNHPTMSMFGLNSEILTELRALGVYLELGILSELLGSDPRSSISLVDLHPTDLLVFGSDLGHADYPHPREIVADWLTRLEAHAGPDTARKIVSENGHRLLPSRTTPTSL